MTERRMFQHVINNLLYGAPYDYLLSGLTIFQTGPLAFLADIDKIPAGPAPYHNETIWQHTTEIMDKMPQTYKRHDRELYRWMVFCHDIGKLTTPKDMLPHHYGHDVRGETLARIYGTIAELSEDMVIAGAFCARQHMRASKYLEMKSSKRRKLQWDVYKVLDNPLVFCDIVLADNAWDERAAKALYKDMTKTRPHMRSFAQYLETYSHVF